MILVAAAPEFVPPPQRGTGRALLLALLAHALLIAALTWGLRWKHEAQDDAIEAEIWAATTQQAAPQAATPAPPSPIPPEPTPPTPAPLPAPAPVASKDPDIALARERKLREQQRQEAAAKEAAVQQKREQERKERERLEAQQRELAEKTQRAATEKAAAAKAAASQQAAAEKERQDNIRRMLGQAGAGPNSQNAGPRSGQGSGSNPSAGYFGRVAALIKRNVAFDPNSISGNPIAEIQIRTSPDGTIVGTPKLVRSSGNSAWDEAALRAVQRTEKVPRDIDGRIPSPFPLISLKPKE